MQAYGVQSLVPGSPAQLSGLLPGDLILSVNGQTVFDSNLINTELVRGRLDLQVIREGFATPNQLTVFPRLVQTVSQIIWQAGKFVPMAGLSQEQLRQLFYTVQIDNGSNSSSS